MTELPQYNPTSTDVLWEGTPEDVAHMATGGRIQTASYRLTTDGLHFASGVVSNRAEIIPVWIVRDADIFQTFLQKSRGVADLHLRLDQQAQNVFGQRIVVLKSIRDATYVRDLILHQANEIRRAWAEHYHRKTVETASAGATNMAINQLSPAQPQPQAIEQAAGEDVLAQLTRLGAMKEKGLLNDEEFSAAKAKLLGL